jgi:hypothetical protein
MFKVVCSGLLCLSFFLQDGGRLVNLNGRNFSIQVLEPEGWELDTRSAPQLANFIFYPEGVNWRDSDAIVFARLIPRSSEESVEEFSAQNRIRFEEGCPFAEPEQKESLPLAVDRFAIQVYDCPGVRKEIVAITSIPGFFAVFALSLQNLEVEAGALESFEKIVDSFRWFPKAKAEEIFRPAKPPETSPQFEPRN